MTPELRRLMQACACRVCLGNGWIGAREPVIFNGRFAYSIDTGRQCSQCAGSGIQPMTDD